MPLARCADCKNPVSTNARACPRCGAVIKHRKEGFGSILKPKSPSDLTETNWPLRLIVAAVGFVILILILINLK